MRAKLANAYIRAGGDDEKAARILGTAGSARLAKKRYLDASATDHRKKPRSGPQGCRLLSGHLPPRLTLDRLRHAFRGGFP